MFALQLSNIGGQVCTKQIKMTQLLLLSLYKRYNLKTESSVPFMNTNLQVNVPNVTATVLQSNSRKYLCNI